MTYKSKSVANTILDIAQSDGENLTNMKLQKLLFFSQGWALAYSGKPIVDEQAEAWDYGPVFPCVYHEFKAYGSRPITSRATELDIGSFSLVQVPPVPDQRARAFLKSVWDVYGKFSAVALSQLTHAVNSPWEEARRANPGMRNTDIPIESIKSYFESVKNKSQAAKA